MRLELQLPPNPDSAARARRAVSELGQHLGGSQLRDVQLLVSELVTNAVRHARLNSRDVIGLLVEVSERALHVEVHDSGPGFEVEGRPRPNPGLPSGWGLFLVEELADRWGVDLDTGTRVWFELDRDPFQTA
jgi:anti-sigma regulatory factor (Ser/Thr protein kinase)